MNALLYLLAVFVSTAAVELCVLRRWYHRRRMGVCIILVAVFSGILWTALSWTLAWIGVSWKAASEPPLTSSDHFLFVVFFVVWTLILSGVAFVPAGLMAIIYRRFRSQ